MCEKCFVYEVHKDHNYWYTICSDESGGSCDCGEEDSWKTDLKCPLHVPLETNSTQTNYSKAIEEYIFDFLNGAVCAIKSFTGLGGGSNSDEKESKAIVLYNDEKHSFAEVIAILSEELSIDRDLVNAYATHIDSWVGHWFDFHGIN